MAGVLNGLVWWADTGAYAICCPLPTAIAVLLSAAPQEFGVTLSTLRGGEVPAMNISFTVTPDLLGMHTLTVEEVSTAPLGNLPVFAGSTPADVSVVVLGLANCTGATGRINATSHSLTITLPSSCVIVANASVTVEIPPQFFAPNPAAGTTVELAIHTDVAKGPTTFFEYTTGMRLPRAALPLLCSAWVLHGWGQGVV